MANIKELKVKIKSTKSTLKITSAMKLVSAAKLAKAQAKILDFKPYSSGLDETVRVASTLAENYNHEYLKENDKASKDAVLVISSEKGLCGGYNSQLYKKVKNFAANNDKDVDLYFIGRKVKELLARDGFASQQKYDFEKSEPTFNEIRAIAESIAQTFVSGDYSKVYVAYNSFVSAIQFDSTMKQVLPMTVSDDEKVKLMEEFPVDFKYEPSAEQILDNLIPEVLNTTVYTAMLDALAAEHSARMTAMDNATNNSKDMIRNLTLTANKLRQAAITTELTEIVSGAESLNS